MFYHLVTHVFFALCLEIQSILDKLNHKMEPDLRVPCNHLPSYPMTFCLETIFKSTAFDSVSEKDKYYSLATDINGKGSLLQHKTKLIICCIHVKRNTLLCWLKLDKQTYAVALDLIKKSINSCTDLNIL